MVFRLKRRLFVAAPLLATAMGLFNAGPAVAQEWPTRAVTLVVPYAPGASNDTFTRQLADILSKKFGKPFIVENRAGAGGFTGANSVARAAPDGYTFLEMPNSIVGLKPVMKVDLDPLVNLTPVGVMAKSPTALVVPSALPIKSVGDFIDYAKANPDKTFYGYAGIGTTQHQHMELLAALAGIKLKGVNYKSSSDAQTDLLAGRLQAMVVTVASTLGQIESGQLRLLAYTDSNFPPSAPKAPTMAEAGLKGMEKAQSWWGIFAPAGLPPAIRDKMNAAINDSLKDPGFVALLNKSSAVPAPMTPAQFIDEIKAEEKIVAEFIERTGLKGN